MKLQCGGVHNSIIYIKEEEGNSCVALSGHMFWKCKYHTEWY